MKKERLAWLDIAKGILILLVILGHSGLDTFPKMVINSFDMAAFFALSGYTLKCSLPMNLQTKKKAKGLLRPYLIFSLIFLIYTYLKSFLNRGESHFNLLEGLISIILPVDGRITTVYGFWFLPSLFLAEMVIVGLVKVWNQKKYLSVLLYALLSVLCEALFFITKKPSIFTSLPVAVAFVGFGCCLQHVHFDKLVERRLGRLCATSGAVLALVIGIHWRIIKHTISISAMIFGIFPLYVLSAIVGTIFIIVISKWIGKCSFLQKCGSRSLYYYGLHYEVLGVVRLFIKNGYLAALLTVVLMVPVVGVYTWIEENIQEALQRKTSM